MAKKNKSEFGEVLKWSLIGFVLLSLLKFIFSKGNSNGTYKSFWDYLKNIFNWSGGSGGSSSLLGGSGQLENYSQNYSVNASTSLNEGKYFKVKEYFKNNVYPTEAEYIANYNKLLKVLDRLRGEWGSEIIIVKGYDPNSDIIGFRNCTRVIVRPQFGSIEQLYDLAVSLEKSKAVQPIFLALLNVDGYKTLSITLND